MASAPSLDAAGAKVGTVDLPEHFDAPLRPALLHLAVRAEQAARRQGTHATKTRAMVRGGGKKPFKQKGTGRARQGSSRAPQMTGGGTVFGPSPHGHEIKINRRERHAAFNSALAAHATRGTVAVATDGFGLGDVPRTKLAAGFAGAWLAEAPRRNVLVVVGEAEAESVADRSFRNLTGVTTARVRELSVERLVGARHLLFTAAALDALPTPRPRPTRTAPEVTA